MLNHERGLKIHRRLPPWHAGLCRSWEVFYTERRSNCFHVAITQVELDLLRGGGVTGLDSDISPAVLNQMGMLGTLVSPLYRSQNSFTVAFYYSFREITPHWNKSCYKTDQKGLH